MAILSPRTVPDAADALRSPAARDSPIRRQYEELKRQHADCVLLFQLGDFFESFEDDARLVARVCGIVLTSREFGKGDRVALAGVPLARLDYFLARLVDAGLHVAVAEQVSPPGAGLVDRVITRVVTPGTIVEPGLLRERENRYLAALAPGRLTIGLAHVDVSTGEFATTAFSGEDAQAALSQELERLAPAELLVPEGQPSPADHGAHVTPCPPWQFGMAAARERLCGHFGVQSLAGFGCDELPEAAAAAGALLAYLQAHDPRLARALGGLQTYAAGGRMALDYGTRRNLEILRGGRTGRTEGSLLAALDGTRSPMGGRLLRAWLSGPLLDVAAIDARLDGVATFHTADDLRAAVREGLLHIGDVERRLNRIVRGVALPRELLDLAEALRAVRALRHLLEEDDLPALRHLVADLEPCPRLEELLSRAVAPPGSGRLIRLGYDPELDALVQAMTTGRKRVAELERVERQRTGIKSLKIGFNKVFGYYLEVTRPNLPLVPSDYQRKQTLAAAERFVTPNLKDVAATILRVEQDVADLERDVYEGVLQEVGRDASVLRRVARAIAHLDVLAGLAEVARQGGYCRPTLTHGSELLVDAGRHPVVEKALEPGAFIPNDCRLDCDDQQVLLLTGPNMGGKSTYLRQVAIISLMAQVGSFVPAHHATLGLVDRIFTRVGAHDDIAGGASTFMVEMTEAAHFLRHATPRSLVVLDEIGRGTSTYDGLSIARAIVEDIHDRLGARTLFATHFHELAHLADDLPRVRVFHTAVSEQAGSIVFLRRITPGAADRSYGIHVARLAGLPPNVTARAEQVLRELERVSLVSWEPVPLQPFDQADGPVVAEDGDLLNQLLRIDVATTTPLEALNAIADIQRRARQPR